MTDQVLLEVMCIECRKLYDVRKAFHTRVYYNGKVTFIVQTCSIPCLTSQIAKWHWKVEYGEVKL